MHLNKNLTSLVESLIICYLILFSFASYLFLRNKIVLTKIILNLI